MFNRTFLFTFLASVVAAFSAGAQITFYEPEFRGDVGTAYSAWDVFTGTSAQTPDVAGTEGTISETVGGSFVTGSGNIYNAGGASSFELDFSTDSASDYVLFQVSTQGTELDYSGVTLTYFDGLDDVVLFADTTEALGSISLGGFGGSAIYTAFEWDLTELGVDSFSIDFAALEAHLSLDAVSLDFGSSMTLTPVPEPSTYALLAGLFTFGGVALHRRRRSLAGRKL